MWPAGMGGLSTLVFEGDRTHPRLIVRRAGNVEHVHLQARWTLRRMAATSLAEHDEDGARKVDECRVDLMEAQRHRKLSAIGREAQLAKFLRNAEGKSLRRPHDLPEVGARASHADRIRRERCGCSALRSVPAFNDLAA